MCVLMRKKTNNNISKQCVRVWCEKKTVYSIVRIVLCGVKFQGEFIEKNYQINRIGGEETV